MSRRTGPGRCKLYAEKQDDRWQIVALNPAGEIEDTEISAGTFRGCIDTAARAWLLPEWDFRISQTAENELAKA